MYVYRYSVDIFVPLMDIKHRFTLIFFINAWLKNVPFFNFDTSAIWWMYFRYTDERYAHTYIHTYTGSVYWHASYRLAQTRTGSIAPQIIAYPSGVLLIERSVFCTRYYKSSKAHFFSFIFRHRLKMLGYGKYTVVVNHYMCVFFKLVIYCIFIHFLLYISMKYNSTVPMQYLLSSILPVSIIYSPMFNINHLWFFQIKSICISKRILIMYILEHKHLSNNRNSKICFNIQNELVFFINNLLNTKKRCFIYESNFYTCLYVSVVAGI